VDPLSFLLWRFWLFFRDPERGVPSGPVVVAPADGRVLYVTELAPDALPHAVKNGVALPVPEASAVRPAQLPGLLIGIYMFPWSVHVNRAPVGGTVIRASSRPASPENRSMVRALMHLAWGLPASDEVRSAVAGNARNTIVIDGELPVAVVQIADRYVRTIDCYVREGDPIERGQRIGMIRMGSQCDLFLRRVARLEVLCRPGDRVRAGETVLARYGPQSK
jgi:phosphatidylserine decarboxylase